MSSAQNPRTTRVSKNAAEAEKAAAVDTVNPEAAKTEHTPAGTEIQIDPQLLAQTVQMRNARLISAMVHENAMLEVALEQERRSHGETQAKFDAFKQAMSD